MDSPRRLHFAAPISTNNRLQAKAQLLAETPQLVVILFDKQKKSKERSLSSIRGDSSQFLFYFLPPGYLNIKVKLARLIIGGLLGL